MTEKRFILDDDGIVIDMNDLFMYIDNEDCCEKLNELGEENEKLKRENESLNSQLMRLDNEFFCQDCLTCRHSKSINIDVECAKGEKEYNYDCDFYEISEEWVE